MRAYIVRKITAVIQRYEKASCRRNYKLATTTTTTTISFLIYTNAIFVFVIIDEKHW